MRGYDRDEIADEYEEYDDYADDGYGQEEEGEEEEEEYEEEEDPKPTKEELEYLELRQRLKERIKRQLMKKEGGSNSSNSNEKKRKLPYDNYGSFFGPSQPVIAQRVIQESKSLLETDHLTPKVSNSLHTNKKSSGSLTGGSRPAVHDPKTKVKNQFKTKVQKLKDTRDYSFLLSEDAELPAPSKVPPPRNVPVRNSEAHPAQVPARSKQALGSNGRLVNGSTSHEERKSISINGHLQSKVGSNKVASASKPNSRPMDPRRQLGNNNGTGPGRPLGSKGLPSKLPATTSERKVSQLGAKTSVPTLHRPVPSKSQSVVSKKPSEQRREQLGPNRDKLLPKRPAGLSRPQVSSGLSRPQVSSGLSRPQVSSGLSRAQVSSGLSRPQVSSGLSRPQVSSGLSRPQTNRPQKPISSHQTSRDNRPKKKPVGRYSDDEDDNAFKMLRQMLRYDPNKYADRDDDLSDMEANFDDIMREEMRSEIIARKEDEEELRKIEEEERRERMAKLKKFKKQRLE